MLFSTLNLPRRRRPGTGDIATPPVRPSVRIVFDIDGMLFEFFMNFLNIEKK